MIYKRLLVCFMILTIASLLMSCKTSNNQESAHENIPGAVQPSATKPMDEKDPIMEQLNKMTLEEKIGQMIIAGIDGYTVSEDEIKLIQEYHIGGFILFGRNVEAPEQLLKLTNSLKQINAKNKTPLFISVDEEGGRISRIPKAITDLPTSKVIGKINSKEFSYEVGMLLAEKVQAFGFNMNFAPVLDINSNPKNPVIGDRAFGSEAELVSELGVQTMKGIGAAGVIPVVKHFPGHGDTAEDSHLGLPSVNNDLNRLKGLELIPFNSAIDNGADCVMVAHILLPKIDAKNPATLSKIIVTDILRQQLKFDGVVITDDMNMGAITKNYDLGTAVLKAVNAGNDILLVAHKYENSLFTFHTLKKAVIEGMISEDRIDQSVYRILTLKKKYGLRDNVIESLDTDRINRRIKASLDSYIK